MPARVLIVDDHESFRRLATRVLMASGFIVVGEAVDAAAAIRQTARLRPDVVLLDVMLPDRSGLEVARELAAEPGAPQVVLTSSRRRSDFGTRVHRHYDARRSVPRVAPSLIGRATSE